MSTATLAIEARDALKKKVKALRRDGKVPANIVSNGKESVAIQADHNQLMRVLQEVGYTQPVILKTDKDEYTVLVTDVTQVPTKRDIQHVTFQEVKRGEQVNANVPVELVGDAPAAGKGLIVLQVLDTIEIQIGALSIPEKFEVDISGLEEEGDGIAVSDITLPEAATLVTDVDAGVVKVEAPRAVEEEPAEAEEAAEGEEAEGDSTESADEAASEEG